MRVIERNPKPPRLQKVSNVLTTNTNMKKVFGRAKEKYKAYRGNGYSVLYWFESYGWEVFKAIYFSIRS